MREGAEFQYVVEGVGLFPLDMLRKDEAAPVGDDDRAVVDAASAEPGDEAARGRHRVKLRSRARFAPVTDRWESFGWRVVEVSDGRPHLSKPVGGRPRVHPEGTTPSGRARASLDALVANGGKRKIFRLSGDAVRGLGHLVEARGAASETEVVEALILEDVRRRGLNES